LTVVDFGKVLGHGYDVYEDFNKRYSAERLQKISKNKKKNSGPLKNPKYAAMVHSIDENVGRGY
jgi:hypothetical protein